MVASMTPFPELTRKLAMPLELGVVAERVMGPALLWGKIPVPNRDGDRDGIEFIFRVGMGWGLDQFFPIPVPVPASPLG